jgi:hypothetical protein
MTATLLWVANAAFAEAKRAFAGAFGSARISSWGGVVMALHLGMCMNIAIPLLASVHVLFAGTVPTTNMSSITWLQGVDRAHGKAYVTHESNMPDWFAVETIDLAARTSSMQVATQPLARSRWFHPMTSDATQSLVAYADMIEHSGPFITRDRDGAGPHMTVSARWIAFEAPTDRLVVANRDGSNPQRITPNLTAAYQPMLSSDGSHIAFTGCAVQPGHTPLCPYRVFVGPVLGPHIAVAGIDDPEPPVFSPDARFVYVASHGCAHRVDVQTGAQVPLVCSSAFSSGKFREAADGRTGVLFGRTRAGTLEVHVLDLPSGASRHVWTLPDHVSVELGSDRILALAGGSDVLLVDLETGHQSMVLRSDPVWLSSQWRDGHTLYAVEHDVRTSAPSTYRILEIDTRNELSH